jgi:hypothetical protein
MKRNERNADIQKEGFTELWDLAFKDNNKVTIADEGGIPIILSAMKTHSSDANVQYYGCGVLWNLALDNDNNKAAIADACGKSAIESAMRNHLSNASVQEKGNGALRIFIQH